MDPDRPPSPAGGALPARAPRGAGDVRGRPTLANYRSASVALLTATDAVGEAEARMLLLQCLRADGVEIPTPVF